VATKIAVLGLDASSGHLGLNFAVSRHETTPVSIVPGRFSSPASSSACGFDGGTTVVAQFLAHHALWCRHGGAAIAAEKPTSDQLTTTI
jgi:hypothetical protein